MAKRIITRGKASKGTADNQPPTAAERNRAIKYLRKQGGAHVPRPANGLVNDSPAQTIEACMRVVRWFAHIEQPFGEGTGGELGAAQADILNMVADALDHAERVVRSVGAQADAEVAHG